MLLDWSKTYESRLEELWVQSIMDQSIGGPFLDYTQRREIKSGWIQKKKEVLHVNWNCEET